MGVDCPAPSTSHLQSHQHTHTSGGFPSMGTSFRAPESFHKYVLIILLLTESKENSSVLKWRFYLYGYFLNWCSGEIDIQMLSREQLIRVHLICVAPSLSPPAWWGSREVVLTEFHVLLCYTTGWWVEGDNWSYFLFWLMWMDVPAVYFDGKYSMSIKKQMKVRPQLPIKQWMLVYVETDIRLEKK